MKKFLCPLRVVSGPSALYHPNVRFRGQSGHYADRIYGRFTTTMGPQIQVPQGANLLFLNLSMTPFVTTLHLQKGQKENPAEAGRGARRSAGAILAIEMNRLFALPPA